MLNFIEIKCPECGTKTVFNNKDIALEYLFCRKEDCEHVLDQDDANDISESEIALILDDLVIDIKLKVASDINNRGFEEQIKFLNEKGVTSEEINKILISALEYWD